MALGWIGGITTLLPPYHIKIYPGWHFTICFYAVLMTYAIFKYQLMDLRIVVTRFGIFVLVYSLILGVPYGLALWGKESLIKILGQNWFWIPLIITTIFATVGPFIYLYIQKRAEDRFFKEQRRYQSTLRQASGYISHVRDLNSLARLLVCIIKRAVRLEHVYIYVNHEILNQFNLLGIKKHNMKAPSVRDIAGDSVVIEYLKRTKKPLLEEELNQLKQLPADPLDVDQLCSAVKLLEAAVVVPSFINNRLVGLFVLGAKRSGVSFTEEDLSAFLIMANQAALAIENIKSLEQMKKAQEKLFQAEKLAYVGQLASSIVHEIRNPLSAIKTFIDFLPVKFRQQDASFMNRFEAIIPKEIARIDKIVNELLDLAKPRQIKKSEVDIVAVVDLMLETLKDNLLIKGIHLNREYGVKACKICCDEQQIQQVLLNLILNAMDAMPQGGPLTVAIVRNKASEEKTSTVRIIIKDSGCGISEEQLKNLFVPFQTTKKQGIGLGLIISQEIVNLHAGEIMVKSLLGQGSEFIISLPV